MASVEPAAGRNEEGREPRQPPGGPGARPRRVVPRGRRRLASSLRAGDPRKAARSRPSPDDSARPRRTRPWRAGCSPRCRSALDLPALEHRDARPLAGRQGVRALAGADRRRPAWTFYEGPPTANGMPGVHHIEARVFKDVFPRFKTMQGYHVPRRGGWDCHGLPVEVAVEKELGLSGKKDIEAYGDRRVQRPLPGVGAAARGRVRGADRADGLLDRPVQGLLDDGRQLHRVGLVVAQGRSSTRGCWSRTTGSARTARAAARRCPTTRWASRTSTRRSPTRR